MNSHYPHSNKSHSAWTSQRPLSLPSFDITPARIQHSHSNDGFAQSSGKSYYRVVKTINILPDNVFLELFDFCQIESNTSHSTSFRPGSCWLILAHVCRRWRQIVLVSPRRLDLTLFCTYGSPVRKNLGSLPPFPIIVDYHTIADFSNPSPYHVDDIIAALEHRDRVRTIKLVVTNSLLAILASVMQEPFAALTTLWLSSTSRNAPVVPNAFLSGPATHLRQIFLEGISFPTLPTLLSSASNLVDLQLRNIPQSGYISPEVMATSLAPLNRLDTLSICFKAPTSRLQLRSSPVTTRRVIPSLVTFNFHGSRDYLELLLAQLDTPRLRVLDITYFNQLDFRIPQLSQLICGTEHLGLSQSQRLHGRIRVSSLGVELDFQEEGRPGSRLTLRISCKSLDWQILHLAQILGQSRTMVSNVERLSINENDLQYDPGWEDSVDDTDWLELLRPFTAVKMLYGSKQLAAHIALALDGVGRETTTDVLPALASLSLEDQPVTSVEKFLAVRQLSGHPVTFVGSALGSATHRKHYDPADLLVDGFIARTFGSEDASSYLTLLLHDPSSEHLLQYYGISHHQGAWYITHNSNLVQGRSPGVPLQAAPPLDYSTMAFSTVVPQKRWAPVNEVDYLYFVQKAVLQLPIFFVNRNGEVGFPLSDILRGCDRDLRNASDFAPLGGKSSTHIRVNWPGYTPWKRPIPIRDESVARDPVTVGRFMKEVGISVDAFLSECMANEYVRLVDLRWMIGAGGISREEVIVIGTINVSAGSWMPILQVNRYMPEGT